MGLNCCVLKKCGVRHSSSATAGIDGEDEALTAYDNAEEEPSDQCSDLLSHCFWL